MPASGILLVDKPTDMTSHDLVNIARKVFHTKKIGHTGTLDPDATGVMVLCIGQATRLGEYLTADDKAYRATLRFGSETDTQDASGSVTAEGELPRLDQAGFESVLAQFLGPQEQIPPLYSAIKKDGQPLYKYARAGIAVEAPAPRAIEIHALHCQGYTPEEAVFEVRCSKGTYIRTLCQDIARACGSCGHMAALQRISAGRFRLADCRTLEELRAAEDPYALLLPMSEALDLPRLVVADEATRDDLFNGRRISCRGAGLAAGQLAQAVDADGLLAVGLVKGGQFVPKKVFHR